MPHALGRDLRLQDIRFIMLLRLPRLERMQRG